MVTDKGETPYTIDRPRGMLTSSDRKYLVVSDEERLRGDDDDVQGPFTRPARRKREKDITKRMYHGILDLALIAREIDQPTVRIDFEDIFQSEDSTSVPRIRYDSPQIFRTLLRGIAADEADRAITNSEDLRAVISPALDAVESAIEKWLNAQRNMTADYELTLNIDNVRSVESLIEELEIRDEPVTGKERLRIGAILERAGYDEGEILSLLGEDPDGDEREEEGSEYPMIQLVSYPLETLTELVASGEITEDEHTEAIRRKSERGDI